MRLTKSLLASLFLIGTSQIAMSAASQEGADRVKAALERVFTATPGLVTVAPAGEAYDLRFDLTAVMNTFSEAGVKGKFTPFIAKLSELGGGKWQVTSSGPLGYSFTREPEQFMEVKIGSFAFDGEFDEAISAFSKTTYSAADYTTTQKITDPTQLATEASGGAKALNGGSISVANPRGGVDLLQQYSMTGLQVDNKIIPPGGAAPIAFSYSIEELIGKQDGKGIRIKEILDLAAWFVARPSVEKIKADQEDLRSKLRASLPLLENTKIGGEAKKLVVSSQIGNVDIAAASVLVDFNGFQKDGKVREQLSLTGLKLPAGLAPPWSAKLVPQDVTIDFTVSGFDAGAIAGTAIDKFDLKKDPPIGPEHQAEFMRVALPGGTLNLTLDTNLIKSELYELTYDGAFNMSLAGMPSGKGTVKMKGFDATLQALQTAAASDPSVQQVLGPLMIAKGFGKTDGDALIWVIESNGTGGILVNGVDVTKM